jgi:membrane associated rhomboid family serine protease
MALNQARSWYRRQAAPITIGIIASMIVFAFVWWISSMKGIENFVLMSGWQGKPWTLFTYPWADTPFYSGIRILCFVFLAMWMFFTGGSVERDLGPTKYSLLWLVMILLPALFIVLLGPLVKTVAAMGMWLPEAGITVVWCVRNPTSQIMLYGLIPLSGRILAWVTIAVTILLSGFGNPLFGFIASLHLAAAWAYAANWIPFWSYSHGGGSFGKAKLSDRPNLKKSERLDKSYYDDVKKREKEREERERLRKLFEGSISDDKDSS